MRSWEALQPGFLHTAAGTFLGRHSCPALKCSWKLRTCFPPLANSTGSAPTPLSAMLPCFDREAGEKQREREPSNFQAHHRPAAYINIGAEIPWVQLQTAEPALASDLVTSLFARLNMPASVSRATGLQLEVDGRSRLRPTCGHHDKEVQESD